MTVARGRAWSWVAVAVILGSGAGVACIIGPKHDEPAEAPLPKDQVDSGVFAGDTSTGTQPDGDVDGTDSDSGPPTADSDSATDAPDGDLGDGGDAGEPVGEEGPGTGEVSGKGAGEASAPSAGGG